MINLGLSILLGLQNNESSAELMIITNTQIGSILMTVMIEA